MTQWVIENVSHWMALIPLAVVAVLTFRDAPVSREAGVVAVGLGLSFLADSWAADLAAQGLNTWWLLFALVPLQSGILVAASRSSGVAVFVAANLTLTSAATAGIGLSSLWMHGFMGVLVALLATGPYARAIQFYCLGTLPGLVLMGVGPFDVGWIGYQAARAGALGLVAWRIGHEHRTRTNVAQGRRPNRPLQYSHRASLTETPLALPPGWFDGTADSSEAGNLDGGESFVSPSRGEGRRASA